MIILSKKRIGIILTCVLIGIFTFSFQVANNEKYSVDSENNTIPTSSTPVSGKTVVLDARPWSSR